MNRIRIVLISIVLLGVMGGGYLFYASALDKTTSVDLSNWEPNARTIKNKIEQSTSVNDEKSRREIFIEQFQRRFRSRAVPIPVGLKFQEDDIIKLMLPARMEPWDMDRVAMAAWRETRNVMGHPFKIDMYVTFIGTPVVKVGELRQTNTVPPVAHISYSYPPILLPVSEQPPAFRSHANHSSILLVNPVLPLTKKQLMHLQIRPKSAIVHPQ